MTTAIIFVSTSCFGGQRPSSHTTVTELTEWRCAARWLELAALKQEQLRLVSQLARCDLTIEPAAAPSLAESLGPALWEVLQRGETLLHPTESAATWLDPGSVARWRNRALRAVLADEPSTKPAGKDDPVSDRQTGRGPGSGASQQEGLFDIKAVESGGSGESGMAWLPEDFWKEEGGPPAREEVWAGESGGSSKRARELQYSSLQEALALLR